MCICDFCKRFRRFRELGVPDEVLDYIEGLELEVDVNNAIMEGKWPSGKERLQEALEKYE